MKIAMAALAVVIVAQAAPAAAQPRGERAERGDRQERLEQRDRPQRDGSDGDRPQRDGGRGGEFRPRPVEAPQASQAQVAPQTPPASDRARFRGDGRYGQPAGQPRDDRQSRDDRRGGDDRRGDGGRDNDRRDWNGRGDNDRGGWDRRDGDRRDWNGPDRNGRDWDRRGDGRRDDHRRWERGRYPPSYFSSHRYRDPWRAPRGFYLRTWSFGEFYPRTWFGDGYWISDAWRYDLPLPPPGFEWVRSGPDALLIDRFSGRIVQVVRDVFWY